MNSDLAGALYWWDGLGIAGQLWLGTQFSFQENLFSAVVAPHSQSGQIHSQVVLCLLQKVDTKLRTRVTVLNPYFYWTLRFLIPISFDTYRSRLD